MKYLMMACVVALGAVSHAAAADVVAGSGSVNYAESEWRKWSENVSGAAGVRVRFVQTGEQKASRRNGHFNPAVFPVRRVFYGSAKHPRHELRSVAYSEYRDARI